MGYNLIELEKEGKNTRAVIEKTSCKDDSGAEISCKTNNKGTEKNGATMVVFSGDLDKAIASFIIATGAATMGKEVTMFFTFWGLNIQIGRASCRERV